MEQPNILTQIREEMTVFDRNGDRVGDVVFVQMTDELPGEPGPETATPTASEATYDGTLVEDIAEAFVGESDLPDEMRDRLRREGFIRVDVGMLRSDRFVLPEQIASVTSDGVYLNVDGDDLLKRR